MLAFALAILLLLPAPAASLQRSGFAMGTTCRVTVFSEEPQGAKLAEAALEEIRRLDGILSLYKPHSDLRRLNAKGGGKWVKVSPDLYSVLSLSKRISAATAGAFDVTVLPLMVSRGAYRKLGAKGWKLDPSSVGYRGILLDPLKMAASFLRPGMGVDLGAIGKGFAVDSAWAVLERGGVSSALIDLGGTVRVLGKAPGGKNFKIALRDPLSAGTFLGYLEVRSGAVSTSGNYFFRKEAGRGPRGCSHIIDPRSGKPACGELAVTVWAPNAALADALSTAFFIFGPKKAKGVISRHFPRVFALFVSKVGRDEARVETIGAGEVHWHEAKLKPARPSTFGQNPAAKGFPRRHFLPKNGTKGGG